jgi:hypothetical protein
VLEDKHWIDTERLGLTKLGLPSHVDENVVRLGRLQDSNAVLSHFNEFSERSFVAVANNFSHNTRLLKSMKNDLDYVFHKISSLKTRIQKQYPNAFKDTVAALDTDDRPDLNAPQ